MSRFPLAPAAVVAAPLAVVAAAALVPSLAAAAVAAAQGTGSKARSVWPPMPF